MEVYNRDYGLSNINVCLSFFTEILLVAISSNDLLGY